MQPNLGFSLVQVNLPLNLFENRITRTPSSSETEVSLYSFGVQNKLISFSLFLMIRFSNKSVFEQPSRANCVRQPRFDTCLQIITSKKHLDIFYSNLKKYLTSRLYNPTSRLLQKHLDLDENNLTWQPCFICTLQCIYIVPVFIAKQNSRPFYDCCVTTALLRQSNIQDSTRKSIEIF